MKTVELTEVFNTSLGMLAVISLEDGKKAKAGDLATFGGVTYKIKRFLPTNGVDETGIAVSIEEI